METTLNFAMFFMLLFLIMGFIVLLNLNLIQRATVEIFNSSAHIMIVSFVSLILGLFIVSFHCYYELKWPLLITILGWLSILRSLVLFTWGSDLTFFVKIVNNDLYMKMSAIVMLLFSAFFAYQIFF